MTPTDWNENQPTKSLIWYDKYNHVKHDRGNGFADASLETALNAIAANIIYMRYDLVPICFLRFLLPCRAILINMFICHL